MKVGIIGLGRLGSLAVQICVGVGAEVYAAAIEAVRPDGTVVQVGLGRPEGTINLQRLTLSRLTLVGSQAGTQEDCAAVLQLISERKLKANITNIGFDEIGDGVEKLERGEVVGRLVAVRD